MKLPSIFQNPNRPEAPKSSQDQYVPKHGPGMRAMALLTACTMILQGPVALADSIWVGTAATGSTTDWGNRFNWTPNAVPTASGAIFVPVAGVTTAVDLGTQSRVVLGINVQDADASGVGAFVLNIGSTGAKSLTIQGNGLGFIAPETGVARTVNLNSAVLLDGSQTWNVIAATDSLGVSGAIGTASGATTSTLTKSGAGVLSLSGTNTFTGGVVLSDGRLNLNSASALGTGLFVVNGGTIGNTGSAITISTNNALTLASDFSVESSSSLNLGTGAVSLGANAGAIRTITVNSGVFALGGVIANGTDSTTPTVALAKSGAGTLQISGANTFTGGVTLNAGQLNINGASALGSGTFTINGGSIDNTSSGAIAVSGNNLQNWNGGFAYVGTKSLNLGSGSVALSSSVTVTVLANTLQIGGLISGGSNGLTKSGAGQLLLAGSAAYTGATVVNGGTLATNGANLISDSSAVTVNAGGTLKLGGAETLASIAGAGNVIKAGALNILDGAGNTLSGILSGSGDVTLTAGTLTLGGANTYTGVTTVNSGAILKLGSSLALGSASDNTVVSSGGVLELNGQSVGGEAVTVSGTGTSSGGALINSSTAAASLSGAVLLAADSSVGGAGSLTISGGISESGVASALTKVGAGALTLAGSSTYTGATSVAAGLLKLGHVNALGDGTNNTTGVAVASGASLDLNGITAATATAVTLSGSYSSARGALSNSGAAATFSGEITLGTVSAIGGSGDITLTGMAGISGNYGFEKVGSGTLFLANSSTMTVNGDITVSQGILQVGTGGSSGDLGASNIVNNGALLFNRYDNYSGPRYADISGSGSLTLIIGTLTLAGNNSYTGATAVKAGNLILSGSSALGNTSGVSISANNASLDLNGWNVSAPLSLSGGNDAFATLTNTGSAASVSRAVNLASTSGIGGTGDITISGTVSGASAKLSKNGTNTLILTGANSYGETRVLAGTLQIGNGGTSGTVGTSNVSLDSTGTLAFNRADAHTVANDITGAGSLAVLAGTVTLSGTYTGSVAAYTGASNIATGATLVVLGGSSAVNPLFASNTVGGQGALVFDLSDTANDQIFNGTLSMGSLTKQGAGRLVLSTTDNSAYTGTTAVAAGALSLLADLGGDKTVASGATLELGASLTSGSLTIGGTGISGSGALANLSGDNTLSGTLNIAADAKIVSDASGLELAGGVLGAGTSLDLAATNGGTITASGAVNLGAGTLTSSSGAIALNGGVTASKLAVSGGVTSLGGDVSGDVVLSKTGSLALTVNSTVGSLAGGSLNGVNLGSSTLTLTDGSNKTIAGVISGAAGSLTLSAGTVVLTGANTYGGLTSVAANAVLEVGANGTSGSIAGDAVVAGTIRFKRSDSFTYAGVFTGGGGIEQFGGTLNLTGDTTAFTGLTTVKTGLLSIGNGGSTGALTGDIAVTSGASLQFNRADAALVYGGVVSGSGSLSNAGSGLVTLTADQTYTGATNISAGTLSVGTLAGTTSITVDNGSLLAAAYNPAATLSVGSAGVAKISGGSLTLGAVTNANTSVDSVLFTATAGTTTLSSLSGAGKTRFVADATVTSGGLSNGRVDVGGLLTLGTISGSAVVNAAALTTTGDISGGVTTVGGTSSLSSISNGTLNLNGATNAVSLLNGGRIVLAGTLTAAGGTQVATGSISGAGKLKVAVSSGALTLNGSNSYAGGTALNSGTLILGHNNALGSGSLTVANGTTLDVAGSGISIANVVSLGGTLKFAGTDSLISSGSLYLSSSSKLNVQASTLTISGDVLGAGNDLTKDGDATLVLSGSGSFGNLTISTGSVLAGSNAVASAATVTNAGTYVLTGSQTFATLAGSGRVLLGSSSLSLSNAAGSYSGAISNAVGSVFSINGGSMDLSSTSNDLQGTISISAGTLSVSGSLNAGGLGTVDVSGSGVLDLAGQTQRVASAFLSGGTIQNGTLSFTSLTLSSGSYNASLTGSGTLTKDSTAATVSLGADNSLYSGSVVLKGGTLDLAHASALGSSNRVSFDVSAASSTLSLSNNITLQSLNGGALASGSQGTVALGSGTLTLGGGSSVSADFGGVITGTTGAALVKVGDGSQALSGDSTGAVFSTTVQAGTLVVANANALGDQNNTVSLSGGTLAISVAAAIPAYNVTSSSSTSAIVLGGSAQALGTLSIAGTLSVSSTAPTSLTFGATTQTAESTFNIGADTSVALAAVSGSFDLTKLGAGALTLTQANTSTANTIVGAGSLLIGASGSLASGSLLVSGASSVVDLGATTQLVARLSLADGLLQNGSLQASSFSLSNATVAASLQDGASPASLSANGGTVVLSAANSYTGLTSVTAGSLQVASTGSISSTGTLSVASGANAQFLSTAAVTLGSITGLGTTTFSGTAQVNSDLASGVVNVAGDAHLSAVAGATVTVGGTTTLSSGLSAGTLTLGTTSSDLNVLTSVTGGSLFLSGNAVAATDTFTAGYVSLAAPASLNLAQAGVDAGTFTGTLTGDGTLGLRDGTANIAGTLADFTGSFVASGTADLTISSATSGSETIVAGTGSIIRLEVAGGTFGSVGLNGGTVTVSSGTTTLGSLFTAASASGSITNAGSVSSTLSVGLDGTSTDFAGTIKQAVGGTLSLAKVGAGTLVLSGTNTYSGGTTVSGGKLVAASSLSLSTGAVVVHGASLGLKDGVVIANAITLSGSLLNDGGQNFVTSPIDVVGDSVVSVLSGALTTGSIASASNNSVTAGGDLTVAGTVSLGSGTLTVTSGNVSLNDAVTAARLAVSGGTATVGSDVSGDVVLSTSGSLALGANSAVGSIAGDATSTVNLGANTLTVVNGSEKVVFGAITGAGGSLSLSAGTLTLAGESTYTGLTSVAASSVLNIGNGGATGMLVGPIDIAGTVRVNRTGAFTYAGTITGGGGAQLIAGSLSLSGDTTGFTGVTTIKAGALLSIGTGGTTGSLSGRIQNDGGTLQLNRSNALTVAGSISGTGSLSQVGSGLLSLTSDVLNYSGATTVSAGTLSAGTLSNTSSITVSGGSLLLAGYNSAASLSVSGSGVAQISGAGLSLAAVSNSSSVSFTASTGTITLASLSGVGSTSFGSNAVITNGGISLGAVSVAGNLTSDISGGSTSVAGNSTIGTISGGSLSLSGVSNTVAHLNGGTINLTGVSGLTVAAGTQAGTGVISGSTGSLVISGSLALNGTNTYGGGTQLNAGLLSLGNSSALGTGSLTAASGTSIDASVSGLSIANALVLGNSLGFTGTNSLTASGNVYLTANTTLTASAGSLTLNGAVNGASYGLTKDGAGTLYLGGSVTVGSLTATAGVLNLTGANELTLASVVDNAAINFASAGRSVTVTSLSGSGAVSNTGALAVNGGAFAGTINNAGSLSLGGGVSISGAIGGSGSLKVTGAATLGAANSYSGETSIDSGAVLTLGNSNALAATTLNYASAGGAVSFGALSAVNVGALKGNKSFALPSSLTVGSTNASTTYSGVLSGNGALTKVGTGTFTLDGGSQTYTGLTTVSAGTLRLGSTTKLAGDMAVSGGRLVLGGENQLGANLTLSSGLISLGTWSQTITGAFTMSGGTLGDSGDTAVLTAASLNITGGSLNVATILSGNGAQEFDRSAYVRSIGDSTHVASALMVGGSNAVTLTAGSVYAGTVSVSGTGNSLVVFNGSLSAATTQLTISGSSNTVTFADGLTPAGTGLTITVGNASSSGAVLNVGNTTGLRLADGQTLKGNGTINGNVTFGSGSVIAPGNSPDILTVDGNATYGNGSTLAIEYDRTAAVKQDQMKVTGAVNITTGAKLTVNIGAGVSRFRPGVDTFAPIFITAASAGISPNGWFTNVSIPAGLAYTVSGSTLTFGSNGFSSLGANGNLSATGALVDAAFSAGVSTGSLSALMDNSAALASTNSSVAAATLAALNPGAYAELANLGVDRLMTLQGALSNRVSGLGSESLGVAGESGLSAWTTGYGDSNRRKGDGSFGAAGYSGSSWGNVSGVERSFGNLTLGVLGAAGNTSATFENNMGSVKTDSWHGGLYSSAKLNSVILDAALAYGQGDNTVKRNVNVPGGGATSGKLQNTEFLAVIGASVPYVLSTGSVTVTPALHLIHAGYKQDGVTESSLNGLEAKTGGKSTSSTATRAGVQAAKLLKIKGKKTRLAASLDWLHSFESDRRSLGISLMGNSAASTQFESSKAGKDSIRLGLGSEMMLTERTSYRLDIAHTVKDGQSNTTGSVSLGVNF